VTTSLHRFFIDPDLFATDRVVLGGPLAHQIARVLRLRAGAQVILLDGTGTERVARFLAVSASAVVCEIEQTRRGRPEPRLSLDLYQALVPREKLEVVLQKGTEVGIRRFVPVWCERSIVPGGDRIDERRIERWQRIVREAAEQCERSVVPVVERPLRFEAALAEALAGSTLLAWERERARSLRAALEAVLPVSHLALFVGPEGGFTPAEVEQARHGGALTVSLGPRILRTETAGPILAALALYEAGDLEPPPAAESA
jgi:16S rRNA (uracil1498-N3)-methyltransferase